MLPDMVTFVNRLEYLVEDYGAGTDTLVLSVAFLIRLSSFSKLFENIAVIFALTDLGYLGAEGEDIRRLLFPNF